MPQKQQLEHFIKALETIDNQGIYDMGFIAANPSGAKRVISDLKKFWKNALVFNLSEKSSINDFLKILVQSFKEEKSLIVNFSGGIINGEIYNQLKMISTINRIQIFNFNGESEINVRQPEKARIVFVSNLQTIESCGIGNFIQLFGPVLDLTIDSRKEQE